MTVQRCKCLAQNGECCDHHGLALLPLCAQPPQPPEYMRDHARLPAHLRWLRVVSSVPTQGDRKGPPRHPPPPSPLPSRVPPGLPSLLAGAVGFLDVLMV